LQFGIHKKKDANHLKCHFTRILIVI